MRNIYLLILLSIYFCDTAVAQISINTSGGTSSTASCIFSYSVGQLFCRSFAASNTNIVQGVQQPFDVYILTSKPRTSYIQISTAVFPNPAADFLILNIKNSDVNNFTYELLNLNGVILMTGNVIANETRINLQRYIPSIYFVKVMRYGSVVKVFKIEKR